MRSIQDIVHRIQNKVDIDFLEFSTTELLTWLPYEEASALGLVPNSTMEDWNFDKITRENVLLAMSDYIPQALASIINHRGISASRSIIKMRVWMWLLGDDEAIAELDKVDYTNYGAGKIVWICDNYGFNGIQKLTEEQRIILINMSCGDKCVDTCARCGMIFSKRNILEGSASYVSETSILGAASVDDVIELMNNSTEESDSQ